MPSGLKTTFDLLACTENEASVQVLIPALDSSDRSIRETALRALFDRRSVVGQREILRRLHTFDESWQSLFREQRGRMSQALRDAVLDGDRQMCTNGCQAILWFQEYDLIPTLATAAEDDGNENAPLAARTLLQLSEQLYEELAAPRDYQLRRDPQLVRRNVTSSLEEAVLRYPKHKRPEIIESFLLLAGRDNATLVQILQDPRHASYVPLVQMLTHSSRPGILRLILSQLENPLAPSALISVISHRTDKKFVELLLRKVGHSPSAGARVNLKKLDNIVWLKGGKGLIDELDDAAQHSAVQLVMASRMRGADVFQIISHLAACGKTGGRRAAIHALARISGAESNQLALQALKDPDPLVQAAAVGQLRQRGIPGALPLLLGFVDHPHHQVRQTARDSLSEFGFTRYLAAYDMLDPEVARSTGLLVKRIDVQTLPLLRQEMQSTSGKRRLRALEIAHTIAAVPQVEELVLGLLEDEDHLVRAAAASVLGDSDSTTARVALEMLRGDTSLAVQEAALASLEQIDHRARIAATTPRHSTTPVGEAQT